MEDLFMLRRGIATPSRRPAGQTRARMPRKKLGSKK
jgi:hypothetical protein